MCRVKRRGRWARCGYGGVARPKNWRDAARKPTNDKKQALPASQKPRVMRITITVDYARRGPQLGGACDGQTHGEGGWGAGHTRATTWGSFRSITCCSIACARQASGGLLSNKNSGHLSKTVITQHHRNHSSRTEYWRDAQHAGRDDGLGVVPDRRERAYVR